MAVYLVNGESLSDVADAIRAKTGGTSELIFPDEFVSEIGSISGGIDIDSIDGAMVFDTNYTHMTIYKNPTNLSYVNTITSLTFDDSCTIVRGIPYQCNNLATIYGGANITELLANSFIYCEKITSDIILPKCTKFSGTAGQWFRGCNRLTNVVIGSIGYGLTIEPTVTIAFHGCTQAGLTITIYCTGANVDAILGKVRNGATNATIIMKASENTTYNGNSFSAGDTIVTSTP